MAELVLSTNSCEAKARHKAMSECQIAPLCVRIWGFHTGPKGYCIASLLTDYHE